LTWQVDLALKESSTTERVGIAAYVDAETGAITHVTSSAKAHGFVAGVAAKTFTGETVSINTRHGPTDFELVDEGDPGRNEARIAVYKGEVSDANIVRSATNKWDEPGSETAVDAVANFRAVSRFFRDSVGWNGVDNPDGAGRPADIRVVLA